MNPKNTHSARRCPDPDTAGYTTCFAVIQQIARVYFHGLLSNRVNLVASFFFSTGRFLRAVIKSRLNCNPWDRATVRSFIQSE